MSADGQVVIQGVLMPIEAARNVEECSVDVAADVELLRSGRESPVSILETCMEGAEADRRDGWREYVSAIRLAAGL